MNKIDHIHCFSSCEVDAAFIAGMIFGSAMVCLAWYLIWTIIQGRGILDQVRGLYKWVVTVHK